ncbi:hypothetical protein HMPREF9163_00276 [Selenomonas sp. oral taxon 138 str. F0429]|nr:hypothetical protein HMPREF9163_00276 [Selenomonas sp. oral taxon 138 str. F0429]
MHDCRLQGAFCCLMEEWDESKFSFLTRTLVSHNMIVSKEKEANQ